MSKLYFCKSDTGDNYIALETASGVYAHNCAPDGKFSGIDLCLTDEQTAEEKAADIREAMGEEMEETIIDMARDMEAGGWMGECAVDYCGNLLTMDGIIDNCGRDIIIVIGDSAEKTRC